MSSCWCSIVLDEWVARSTQLYANSLVQLKSLIGWEWRESASDKLPRFGLLRPTPRLHANDFKPHAPCSRIIFREVEGTPTSSGIIRCEPIILKRTNLMRLAWSKRSTHAVADSEPSWPKYRSNFASAAPDSASRESGREALRLVFQLLPFKGTKSVIQAEVPTVSESLNSNSQWERGKMKNLNVLRNKTKKNVPVSERKCTKM